MDIEYLLILQNFREQTGEWLSSFMSWVTKLSISYWPVAIACMIYWVFDRNAGKRILSGLSLGILFNGFLKVTFCVLRPWIRDARIEPWGDSKVTATGYSFPSGHSSFATAAYGNMGLWQRKRHVWLSVLAFFMLALTMFSRNFLGVHTPQDVLVGCASSFVAIFIATTLEKWSDKHACGDISILIGGILLCVAAALYYELKSYPYVYNDDGSLLVDPMKMKYDCYEGIGAVSTFVICRYIERRKFHFDTELDWKSRFIIGTFAMIPGYWLYNNTVSIMEKLLSRSVGKFAWFSVAFIYAMLVVPSVMQYIARHCAWVHAHENTSLS